MPVASIRLAAIAVLTVALATPASAIQSLCEDTRLSRTFAPPPARAASAAPASAFEVTRDDFMAMYAHGFELHFDVAPADKVFTFDVGVTGEAAPWSGAVPDLGADYYTVVYRIVDPATTPFADRYPDATHAIIASDDPEFEGTYYDYYTAEAGQFVINGSVLVLGDGSEPEEERYNQPLIPFPLDTTLDFADEGVYYFEDDDEVDPNKPFYASQHVGFHRYGSLDRPDGTSVDVGVMFSDSYFYDMDTGDLFDWDSFYTMIGVDGTQLSFRIADPPDDAGVDETPIQGEVWIDEVEFLRVVRPAVAVTDGPDDPASWSIFPNPTADVVRFSEPLTATVFDVMGRAVRQTRQARQVDLRGLAAGTYVVRSEAGQSRTVTLRR